MKENEHHVNSLEYQLSDYLSPGCHCNLEDKILNKFTQIDDINVNPLTNLLTVRTSKDFNSIELENWLKKCGYKHIKKQSKTIHSKKPMDHSSMDHGEMKPQKHDSAKKMHEEMDHKEMDHSEHFEHEDHGNHHEMMVDEFRLKTYLVLLATIPVLILSPTVQDWLNIDVPNFGINTALLVILATFIVVYGGSTFFSGALRSLRTGILDMNVLVSLAVLSGYLYSLASTFIFADTADFYWEISTLVLFLDFGHWMEMRAVAGASGALNTLVKLIPPKANLVQDGEIVEIDTSELQINDIILIRPGDKIPIDGKVIDGETSVNESMLTGEAMPIPKQIDDQVIGGTINQTGSIRVEVDKIGEDTALAQIISLVKTAQSSKPKSQKLADRAAHYLTLVAIIVSSVTFLFWIGIGDKTFVFALTLTITVLVIACPHALGLAIPTVTSISTTLAAQNGMLVKDMIAMELAKDLDYIVFDKTGTLTMGEFGVSDVVSVSDWDNDELLLYTAALEINSEHVIAKGVVKSAKDLGLEIPSSTNFDSIPGKGAKAIVNDKSINVGNAALMKSIDISIETNENEFEKLAAQGKTVIYISTDEELKGLIALSDIIRDESRETIKKLQSLGVKTAMLTGDNIKTATYVAQELNLDLFYADVLPEEKAEKIKEIQLQGLKVAMVGDGVNDAPALTQAELGIAIGAGTDVAVDSAQIVLVKNNPLDIVSLFELSKATSNKMKQNLAWATGYNTIAIPTAAGLLIPFGVVLRPELAALAMALSSIIVVTNAFLLKRLNLSK
ncbi:MAG: heavy metal translocating P-type ATPase [Candidatus Kariarchaeaceae archaeon]|jgi:Cu2+-exporting ATPase